MREEGHNDPGMATRLVGGRSVGSVRHDDFYETPPIAVERLLDVESFSGGIWECACGLGAISTVLRQRGYKVIDTDLVHRGFGQGGVDFLMEHTTLAPNILTNPPFKLGKQFAKHACTLTQELGGKVAFLMRLQWLEGVARRLLFETTPLARVWVFSARIPRMHRHGYSGKTSSSSIAFAWFVWDHQHDGPPTLGWL